jgi:hypothetical protein
MVILNLNIYINIYRFFIIFIYINYIYIYMSYSQLVNNSEIDNKLIGNPQITFFKSVFRRHTSFYKGLYSDAPITYVGSAGDNPVNQKSPKDGISHGAFDLITNIFIEHKISNITTNNPIYANIGNTVIDTIKFKVGANIDLYTLSGLYMEARAELDNPYIPSHDVFSKPPSMTSIDVAGSGSNTLTCNTGSQYNINTMAGGVYGSFIDNVAHSTYSTDTFYTYPNFYFCKEYGSSFPICALNNTKTWFEITYRPFSEFLETPGPSNTLSSTVHIEYVNLSDDERLRFINDTDPYIYYDINEITFSTPNIPLSLHHPIRQIFFIGAGQPPATNISLSTPTSLSKNGSLSGIDIKINSDSLYSNVENNLSIFTKQNIRHFKGYGRELSMVLGKSYGYLNSIGVHSFCLDNTNTPSGHLSSNIKSSIYLKPDSINTDNIKIYVEVIKFYKIVGGQIAIMYT